MISELVAAQSVAVVGATGDTSSLFGRPLRYLQTMGFKGRIYPVNPRYDEISELRCYPAVEALPETVDAAILLVGAPRVIPIMEELGRSGTRNAVVCAAGFSETGPDGRCQQDELVATATRYGISFTGPNSQGIYVRESNLTLTFNPAIDLAKDFPSSGIVYSGQSGAVGGQIAGLLKRSQLSLAGLISTGNEAQLSAIELAEEALALESARSVIIYSESIARPDRFGALLAASEEAGKPVVLLLGGFSQLARDTATSHTGSLAPPGAQVQALADYYGVPICQEPAEAIAAAQVLQQRARRAVSRRAAPRARARIGMLTTSGGSAVLAADLCSELGVELPPLARETAERLSKVIPSFGSTANPVDVTAEMQKSSSDAWVEANLAVAEDPSVDILWVAIGYTVGAVGVARSEGIARLATLVDKPIVVSWLAPPEDTAEGRAILSAAGIPVLDTLTGTINAAIRLARSVARRPEARAPLAEPGDIGLGPGASDDEIRAALPLRFAERTAATDAVRLAEWLGERRQLLFVVKGEVPGVTHKSDWGGVVTGVAADAVPAVIEAMAATAQERFGQAPAIWVEEDFKHVAELLVGFQRGDTAMPPTLMLGWGGYFAEALGDTTVSRCVGDADLIAEHLSRLRFSRVLAGFRGNPAVDVAALAAQLGKLADAFTKLPPEVSELEINPVAIGTDGRTTLGLDLLVIRDKHPGS